MRELSSFLALVPSLAAIVSQLSIDDSMVSDLSCLYFASALPASPPPPVCVSVSVMYVPEPRRTCCGMDVGGGQRITCFLKKGLCVS